MMNKIKKIFFASASTMLALPALVSAQYAPPSNSHGLASDTDVNATLEKVLNYILAALATLSILVIVIAGIMYITSGGDEARVDKAKSWLTYAIIGLIIALLGFVIVSTVSRMLVG